MFNMNGFQAARTALNINLKPVFTPAKLRTINLMLHVIEKIYEERSLELPDHKEAVLSVDDLVSQMMRTAKFDLDRDKALLFIIGAGGELGEVLEIVKKVVYHDKPLDDTVLDKLEEELGDVLWYLFYFATVLGFSVEKIMTRNIEKLAKRYPEGYNHVDAKLRRDVVEG